LDNVIAIDLKSLGVTKGDLDTLIRRYPCDIKNSLNYLF